MSHDWDEIKTIIESLEAEKIAKELTLHELQEGVMEEKIPLTARTHSYLEYLGGLSVGLSLGIFTIIFNFMIFVWFLHIEFYNVF